MIWVLILAVDSVFGSPMAFREGDVVVQRHLYTAALDSEAKVCRWVTFSVKRRYWDTDVKIERAFYTPSGLRDVCLESSDYDNSGYARGHLVGKQFFQATMFANEVNEMSVVVPQRQALNAGPWLQMENWIREQSKDKTVFCIAGTILGDDQMQEADEPHRVPSATWMIVRIEGVESAWLMPQEADGDMDDYRIDPAELRQRVDNSN